MPTLILLDNSLSMSRLTNDGQTTIKDLAIVAINTFLDLLSQNNPLELVTLSTFSSTFNVLVSFTRDHTEIRSVLPSLPNEDSTNIKTALASACTSIHLEWGLLLPTQILMITDGEEGLEDKSINKEEDILLFNSTTSLIILNLHHAKTSLTNDNDHPQSTIKSFLIAHFSSHLSTYSAETPLTVSSVMKTITTIFNNHFSLSNFQLKSGNHSCSVNVYPPIICPDKQTIWDEMVVCGTLFLSDLSNPPFHSRHLVLPVTAASDTKETIEKQATFTVLLHGSLKVEGMVAVVQISTDWYGILYVQSDSKKKSNLNLSLFKHGQLSVPWLGSFSDLTPLESDGTTPVNSEKPPFPVTTYTEKKSYSQNCVVWTHNVGLQGDIQKIIRNGRKIPEKQSQFYKELNRVRKAALSIGFFELFPSLASLLEREALSLPNNHHPSTPLQLNHAAKVLRSSKVYDVNHHIHPLTIN